MDKDPELERGEGLPEVTRPAGAEFKAHDVTSGGDALKQNAANRELVLAPGSLVLL